MLWRYCFAWRGLAPKRTGGRLGNAIKWRDVPRTQRPPNDLCNPARLPDGSRVRRESHARFCERPVVQFRRPTHPHICVKKRSNGIYTVLQQTIRKRMQTKLNEVKAELQRRMHEPIPEQGKWLRAVVGGHFRYYGV